MFGSKFIALVSEVMSNAELSNGFIISLSPILKIFARMRCNKALSPVLQALNCFYDSDGATKEIFQDFFLLSVVCSGRKYETIIRDHRAYRNYHGFFRSTGCVHVFQNYTDHLVAAVGFLGCNGNNSPVAVFIPTTVPNFRFCPDATVTVSRQKFLSISYFNKSPKFFPSSITAIFYSPFFALVRAAAITGLSTCVSW
jgi:hypothetical protein